MQDLLFAIIFGLWLFWLWTRRHLYLFALRTPGFFGSPIVGVATTVKRFKYLMPALTKMFEDCKSYSICIWVGLFPVYLTMDPEIIEKVLSSADLLNKSKVMYTPVEKLFEGGLIVSPAEAWQHNRKMINPSFNHKVLLSFMPIFHKAKNNALHKFDALVGTGAHKLKNMVQRISLSISVETTMGKTMNEYDQVDADLAEKFSFALEKTIMQVLLSFVHLEGLFVFNKRFKQTKQYLHKFVHELIINKLNKGTESMINVKDVRAASQNSVLSIKKAPNIFIDQAIEIYQKKQFSWHDIIAESNTIVTASFETTANGIFSTLVLLAMHPEVQEKLYDEIVSVFPEKDFQMDYEHMQQLPYLSMVINETLRVLPSVPIIARQVVKDTQLTKDLLLPKDLQVMISIYHLHRNTKIWGPNANKFNPDNFLPENLNGKHSHAYIPFSKGIRNCIGWRYALFAIKVILAGLVRNYRFTTTFKYDNLQFVTNISLRYLVEPGIEIERR